MYTDPLYGIPNPKRFDFPLLVVRYMCRRLLKPTYESSPFFEICGGSTTYLPRVLMNIQVSPAIKVLDFVDSWL